MKIDPLTRSRLILLAFLALLLLVVNFPGVTLTPRASGQPLPSPVAVNASRQELPSTVDTCPVLSAARVRVEFLPDYRVQVGPLTEDRRDNKRYSVAFSAVGSFDRVSVSMMGSSLSAARAAVCKGDFCELPVSELVSSGAAVFVAADRCDPVSVSAVRP